MTLESDPEHNPSGEAASVPGAAGAPPTLGGLLPLRGRALLLLLVNAALVVVAFGPLAFFDPEPSLQPGLEGAFFTPADSSPIAILGLAVWLLARRWGRLARLPLIGGRAWLSYGLLVAAAGCLAWSIFVRAGDLRAVALMLTLLGFGCLYGGSRAMRALLVPTAFLALVIPMPAPMLNALITKMQFCTADFTGFLLNAVGLNSFVAGETIVRANDRFAIIEACSGIRIAETMVMLAVLMLDLFRRAPLHSAILLAATLPLAFVFNAFRAITLIINPHSEIVSIHMLQGIAMLLGGLLTLYAVDGLLERVLPPPKAIAETLGSRVGSAPLRVRARSGWLATGALAILAAIALFTPPWPLFERAVNRELMSDFNQIEGWTTRALGVEKKFLGRIGMMASVHRRYERPGEAVDLYAAVGARGNRARSVLFTKAHLLGSGWDTEDQGVLELAPGGISARWRVVKSLTRRHLVVSWHEHAGGFWEESARSFLGLDGSPLRRPGEAMTVRISTPIAGRSPYDRAEALARLEAFHADLRPKLDALGAVLRADTG